MSESWTPLELCESKAMSITFTIALTMNRILNTSINFKIAEKEGWQNWFVIERATDIKIAYIKEYLQRLD